MVKKENYTFSTTESTIYICFKKQASCTVFFYLQSNLKNFFSYGFIEYTFYSSSQFLVSIINTVWIIIIHVTT